MTYPTAPPPFYPPAPQERFSGFATASLTLGIVGAVFSIVPYLDVLTMLGAIVGLVLGGIALFGPRKVAASFGVGLSIVGIIITSLVMTKVTSTTDNARAQSSSGYPPALYTTTIPAVEPQPPSGPVTAFGSGTYVVGTDVVAGTYKTTGSSSGFPCYWARLKNTSGEFSAIIANGNPTGPTTVTISNSDGAFETSACNTWRKVS